MAAVASSQREEGHEEGHGEWASDNGREREMKHVLREGLARKAECRVRVYSKYN